MGVATTIRVVCGHAGRRCCGCQLRPCVLSPLRVSSVAVGVATVGCGSRRRRHPYRLRPCMLSPPPCKSLRPWALLLQAAHIAAAMHVVCGCECCRCHHVCHLWPCTSPLWAMRVTPGPAVQSCNRKKKVSEKEKKKKRKHPHRRREIAAAGRACRLRPCMSLPPCTLLLRAMRITAARVVCGCACRSWAYSTVM